MELLDGKGVLSGGIADLNLEPSAPTQDVFGSHRSIELGTSRSFMITADLRLFDQHTRPTVEMSLGT